MTTSTPQALTSGPAPRLDAVRQTLHALGTRLIAENRPMTPAEWAEFHSLRAELKRIKGGEKRRAHAGTRRTGKALPGPG